MSHATLERVLSAVPADVWHKIWPDTISRLLRRCSKSMQLTVDAMQLPAAVRMSQHWWLTHAGLPSPTKWALVLQQLFTLAHRSDLTGIALHCGSRGPHGLVGLLQQCTNLQRFSLASNGNLGASGTAVVAHALRPCTAITSLHLRCNDMGLDGAILLQPRLAELHALRHLDLGLNRLHDSGVEILAQALHLSTALATLNLSGNQCQAAGAIALSIFVPQYSSLTHLDVGHNPIQNVGAFHLSSALVHCLRLRHLDFSNTRCLRFHSMLSSTKTLNKN